ncbi:hypothetical protein BH18ACT11_BH18ACT11_12310 [soil metagenome]
MRSVPDCQLLGGTRITDYSGERGEAVAKIGILTMSDGRDFVHEGAGVGAFAREVEDSVAGALKAAGHEVVRARESIWTNRLATSEARRITDERPDLTIFNIPVWAFPHFSMLAAKETRGPLLLFSNLNPAQPGMVGMLAAGGALDQIGRHHLRAWGNVSDPDVLARLEAYTRAAKAVSSLRGSTFGR